MKRTSFFLLLFLSAIAPIFAQQESQRFWLFLEEKETNLGKSEPPALSPIAIQKRTDRGIQTDAFDVAVSQGFISYIQNDKDIQFRTASRWLNAISIETHLTPNQIAARYPFVKGIKRMQKMVTAQINQGEEEKEERREKKLKVLGPESSFDYGQSFTQQEMLGMPAFHNLGFQGEGIVIAVLDAGFPGVDTLPPFQHIWKKGRMVAWQDFVENEPGVFEDDTHGLQVLSCIAAIIPGSLIGTSPGASFILGRTEDARSESRKEEDNWVKAMEWADSLGADIIHSSLGYSTFDEEFFNYSYDSLDGNTAVTTRAAKVAVSRGILVSTSAGNEGFSSWHYITAPCDCDGVLCIGSVDSSGRHSYFSSVGPTFDGRTKPDVVAMGSRTLILQRNGQVGKGDGTSYAAPLVAGLAACLMQAHPTQKGTDIVNALKKSADKADEPNNRFGFGLPNALKADSLLTEWDKVNLLAKPEIGVAHHFRLERNRAQNKFVVLPVSGLYALVKATFHSDEKESLDFLPAAGKKEMYISLDGISNPSEGYFEFFTDKGVSFRINLSSL